MTEIDELNRDIEKLRANLYRLAQEKSNDLQDPEVIAASQILNAAIVKYNELF